MPSTTARRSSAFIALLFAFSIALIASRAHPAFAQATAPNCCGPSFIVTGEIHHFKTAPGIDVASNSAASGVFAEQVYGTSFTASVAGLPAGKYTIEIDLAETYHRAAGQRVFNIAAGSTPIAEKLDVFQAAGGFARPYRVTATVDHSEDSIGGPLAIQFTTVKDKAFFNAIYVRDANGQIAAGVVAKDVVELVDPRALKIPEIKDPPIYNDPAKPVDRRIDDLIRRMSLKEKVAQMMSGAPAIDRLGVPAYHYWNEALHGVARAGIATVYPQAIGMAATWDPALLNREAETIGDEGRAKYNDAIRKGKHAQYYGLTFWTPNINIFRDPRWGRGQETYGEDPFLTSRMGVAFIRGLQGDDPKYMKAMACAKHFAVHSGPEAERHRFDAVVSNDDLYDTYLPQFEAAVREGRVGGVMGAYNSVDGEPACSNSFLLTTLLRDKWGFTGYVVSDCGAISDIYRNHHTVATEAEAAARAVNAGCNLACDGAYSALVTAVNEGLIIESRIDGALHHDLGARFRLGLFDPDSAVAYSKIPMTEVDSIAHSALALKAAEESIVLLKNDGVLPLNPAKLKRIAVIGANADSIPVLLGNYNGTPSHPITILDGIKSIAGPDVEVVYSQGGPLALHTGQTFGPDSPEFKEAVNTAQIADVVIFVGGITGRMEGEEGAGRGLVGFSDGDRTTIELPAPQTDLLKALKATGKPVVFVNCSGSAMAFGWAARNLPAIVQAWYPGENGGTAVANVLFGRANPGGRLPVTFYRSTADLPEFTDYRMANRTYRYFKGTPLYPFGYGLSYTKFTYGKLTARGKIVSPDGTIRLSLNVKNAGARDGDEVVQVYFRGGKTGSSSLIRRLCAFQRISIAAGKTATVNLDVPVHTLRRYSDAAKGYVIEPGAYEFQVGASSGDIRGVVGVTVSAR